MINVNENNTPSVLFKTGIDEIDMKNKIVWKTTTPPPLTGESTLITGPLFNNIYKSWLNATSFKRSSTTDIPSNASDISDAKDKSVIMWYDTASNTVFWYSDCLTIYLNPNSSRMFCDPTGKSQLKQIDLSSFNTSKVTDMNNMFYYCIALTSLDVSHFDTSNVTKMNNMFYECRVLTSLDVSHFDTSKVTNMSGIFYNCKVFTSIDVSHFDTSKVTDMSWMFGQCRSLTTINYGTNFVNIALLNLASLVPANGTYYMFSYCQANKPNWTGGDWYGDHTFLKS